MHHLKRYAKPQMNADEPQMDDDSTRIALMTRMHTDTKSTHIFKS
ncbi:MAG: hypothetical protein Q7J35_10055 [Candidatus Methanoperedens sp.]|nr:hypothetical protein [Candidatus Methanoperedens sp.]